LAHPTSKKRSHPHKKHHHHGKKAEEFNKNEDIGQKQEADEFDDGRN